MHYKNILTATILSAALMACTSTNEEGTTAKVEDNRICTYEKTTSSHIKKKICRTKEQIEQERKASAEQLRKMQVDQDRRG